MDSLTLEQITNAIYAVRVLALRNGETLEELGTTGDDVETLVRYAQAFWYQQSRESCE